MRRTWADAAPASMTLSTWRAWLRVSGRVSSTKVPLPRERRIRPSASSRPSACRTVERAMP
ncbi:Uncharacterised protein [Bordetella pertussis]|nr:Uncharacterised protein [Bordetella pertussis]